MADENEQVESSEEHRIRSFFERVEGLTFVSALAMFIISVTALGWLPRNTIEQDIAQDTPPAMKPYTDLELLGRHVYGREGCAYCHTQVVRHTKNDFQRFGPVTESWEYQYDFPHLLGTRRIGPDLSREANARPDSWQYAHLYNPRYTVPQSMMPGYPWLFEKDRQGRITPTKEGRALVAYLNYLGRAMQQYTAAQGANPPKLYNRGKEH
jgi:cbb3-type cytochrome c oxidase subunit II